MPSGIAVVSGTRTYHMALRSWLSSAKVRMGLQGSKITKTSP